MLLLKTIIKASLTILIILMMTEQVQGRKITVGSKMEFNRVSDAAAKVKPGDTIVIKSGVYPGGEVINGLKGRSDSWIIIQGEIPGKSSFNGGSSAFHLSDPEFIVIEGLTFSGQTGNGLNIDDGGSYDTPAGNIIIRNCIWENMAASGNNDELKMSGVDDFEITDCIFRNGSKGGSMIDMVGCHRGIITGNLFENGGSNSIQAKGGSKDIVIKRNRFNNGGERAINIGGSTGMQFFRPIGISYEASDIKVWSNIFKGGTAAVAFVGAVNCEAMNNIIINPVKWVIRILQENTNQIMQPCSNNSFMNNNIVFGGEQSTALNIGPNTKAETFTISNNIWNKLMDEQ